MNQRKFSIHDIAQEAKVSSATVSRVFAGSAHVSAKTQALVLQIAQAHGYEPKVYQKRQHTASSNRLVGIVVADLRNPFFLEMIDYMENALAKQGIDTVICAYGDFKIDSAYHLTLELLEHHPEITALFCSNNMMAVGAIRAIYAKGMSIPQDIALIAPGSVHAIDMIHGVNISEIDQPIEQMGEEAAGMMIEKLSGSRKRFRAVRRITYEGRLILRGSEIYPSHQR